MCVSATEEGCVLAAQQKELKDRVSVLERDVASIRAETQVGFKQGAETMREINTSVANLAHDEGNVSTTSSGGYGRHDNRKVLQVNKSKGNAMAKYFVEYGALQSNARRLIECETSALAPKKISEAFAREIADALNNREPGASLSYMPSESDLAELEKHAKHMQDHSIYGGGVLLSMVADYRRLLPKRTEAIRHETAATTNEVTVER